MGRKKMYQAGALLVILAFSLLLTGCGKAAEAYEQGMEFAKDGKYEKSLSYFEDAISRQSDRAEYYIAYGMALNRLGRYEEAKEAFDTALTEKENKISKENNKQLYYGTAIAEYGLGEYKNTEKYCKKALEIEYLSDMDCNIRYTCLAAYAQLGSWDQAEKMGKQIIDEDEKYMEAYPALAQVYVNLEDTESAVKTYQDAIEVKKSYYDAYFGLYQLYMDDGQTEEADSILDELAAMSTSSAQSMLAVGRAYYYKQDYDKAQDYLSLAYDSGSKESLYYMGLLSVAENDYEDAVATFQQYITENKTSLNAAVYYQLALIDMEQEDYDGAQSMLAKGLASGDTAVMQEMKKTQVILSEKQNHYKEAKKLAKEYIACYPADTQMTKELSFINTRLKK